MTGVSHKESVMFLTSRLSYEICREIVGNEIWTGPLTLVFLSCYFLVEYGVKLGLMYALELNLDRTYVLGLELESCFLISSST